MWLYTPSYSSRNWFFAAALVRVSYPTLPPSLPSFLPIPLSLALLRTSPGSFRFWIISNDRGALRIGSASRREAIGPQVPTRFTTIRFEGAIEVGTERRAEVRERRNLSPRASQTSELKIWAIKSSPARSRACSLAYSETLQGPTCIVAVTNPEKNASTPSHSTSPPARPPSSSSSSSPFLILTYVYEISRRVPDELTS